MRLACLIILLSVMPSVRAADVLPQLLEQAEARGLHQRTQWLALLHYRVGTLGGEAVSQVDDAGFFLAADGRRDARAEMIADITAFLRPSAAGHAQCRFPARWSWLKQQLDVGNEHDVACPRFERWREAHGGDSLTLIFPAMYLNNPGSSFGHTFIRFDNHRSTLLSNALNYAAHYDPEDGFLPYAWKGITGGYNGLFRLRRYYRTVKEYSKLENRDIWEYRMDYDADEIDLLVRHVWEVIDVEFDYFFFTENCSYRLLALLDVLREGSQLAARDNFPLYAIPVDTVRVLDEAGVITGRQFRPSLSTQIDSQVAMLDDAIVDAAVALADGELDPATLDIDARADAFDLAADILEFRQQADGELAQRILLQRSRIERGRRSLQHHGKPPEQGHRSARAGVGIGRLEDLDRYSVSVRPAFHDVLDDQTGFVEGAEVDIMALELSALQNEGIELEQLVFVGIRSLPPMRSWYSPLSWKLDIRLQRHQAIEFGTPSAITSLQFTAAGGATTAVLGDSTRLFALLASEVSLDHEIERDYCARLGVQLGWLTRLPGGAGQLLLQYESLGAVAGQDSDRERLSLAYQFSLGSDYALRLAAARDEFDQREQEGWSLELFRYF